MLKKEKTTEDTEIHGVFVTNPVFPPCNSAYSVVNLFGLAVNTLKV
jgi:hypothetical protein